ncbi:unnamed protein product, partial [Tetraodon nigroviridis]
MTDHYAQVSVKLGQVKSFGNDAEKEGVHPGEQVPASPVSPDPPGVATAGSDATDISTHPRTTRPRQETDERDPCGNLERSFHGSEDSDHLTKNFSNLTGGVKIQKGTTETNGNFVQPPANLQEAHGEDAMRPAKKRRPVTVDSAKAKTSLEALKLSIKQLKWREVPLGRRAACDIYWHGVSFHDNDHIVSGQVNKFPGEPRPLPCTPRRRRRRRRSADGGSFPSLQAWSRLLRKVNTSRAVRTMQELFPEEYDFYPRSWILPEEYQLFCAQIRVAKEKDPTLSPTFIVKPDGGSQGDGIYLIRDPSELKATAGPQARQGVVQEYVHKPLLIDKLKFDIRLYVLMKSLEPLEIYIAKEGLTRFCTEPYQEPSQKNLSHVFMHLTNYSLNVHSGNFVHSESQSTGSKRSLSSVLYRLAAKGVDVRKVWSDIIALVIKTLIAVVPELKVHYHAEIPPGKPGPSCFQVS